MEIEPEIIDPVKGKKRMPGKMPGKGSLILFGILGLIIGGALLFFMFWVALFFVAAGAIAMVINLIRGWFRGEKPLKSSQSSVRFYINRGPPDA